MVSTTIERDILIDAPADVVWTVITRPEGIGQWFCEAAELDLRPGGAGSLTFSGHGTLTERRGTADELTAYRDNHVRGWTEILGNLQRHLAERSAAPDRD